MKTDRERELSTKSSANSKVAIAVIFMLCLSSLFALGWGLLLARASQGTILDFKIVYYGARCLVQHRDPYSEAAVLSVYLAEGGKVIPKASEGYRTQMIVVSQMYLPTAALLMAPFGFFAWPLAYSVWIAITVCGITLAAVLMWSMANRFSEGASLYLISFLLLNSGVLFAGGNPAGVAVSLCITGAWCFLENRYTAVGVVCMAASLAIKPHDAGLVWLFFLLAGSTWRRLAIKTLVLTAFVGVVALIVMQQVSPHWLHELQANVQEFSVPGSYNDPGPEAIKTITTGMRIDLETVTSVIRDTPGFYKATSYVLCLPLLIIWAYLTIGSAGSRKAALFGIAAIVPLTMLPVYHRPYDAKLLLLVVPACAALQSASRVSRRISLALTGLAIALTSDLPLAFLSNLAKHLNVASGTVGAIETILLLRPAPFALLALGVFNLFQYAKICRESKERGDGSDSLTLCA